MLTVDGLEVKRFPTIINDIQDRLDNENTGIVITDVANKAANNIGNSIGLSIADLYNFLEKVYYSFDPHSAEGESLDRLVAYKGLIRKEEKSAEGYVSLVGYGQGIIPEGFTVSDARARQACSKTSVAVGSGSYYKLLIILPDQPVNGTVYSYEVNSTTYTHTASNTETKSSLADNLLADTTSYSATKTTDNNILVESKELFNLTITSLQNLSEGAWEMVTPFYSITKGNINFSANTLNILVSTSTLVTSVYNPEDFTAGEEKETDYDLRQRFLNTVDADGKSTIPAILRKVSDVSGVDYLDIINNPTANTVYGLPPHSYEVIVSGGTDNDIAQTIFENSPAGIESYGSTNVSVSDSTGTQHTIGFSRPTDFYIFVNVDYELDGEVSFPADGESQIRDALLAFGTDLTGSKLIPSKFNIPVYNVSGVGEVVVTLGGSTNASDVNPSGGYSSDRLSIPLRHRAIFSTNRMVLNQTTLP